MRNQKRASISNHNVSHARSVSPLTRVNEIEPVQSLDDRPTPVTSQSPIVHVDLHPSEDVHSREQLENVLSRPVHEPLLLIHRPLLFPASSPSHPLPVPKLLSLSSPARLVPASNGSLEKARLSHSAAIQTEEGLRSDCAQSQNQRSHRKLTRKHPSINDHSIPLALRTSLHSVTSLYHDDYFLSQYFHS